MSTYDKRVLVIYETEFQLPARYPFQEMIQKANIGVSPKLCNTGGLIDGSLLVIYADQIKVKPTRRVEVIQSTPATRWPH